MSAMAYVYLLDMQKYIDQRLISTKDALGNLSNGSIERKYLEGRIQVLSEFKDFLTKKYIPKLPRRIRESYLGQ